jgi:hypothetical protein
MTNSRRPRAWRTAWTPPSRRNSNRHLETLDEDRREGITWEALK